MSGCRSRGVNPEPHYHRRRNRLKGSRFLSGLAKPLARGSEYSAQDYRRTELADYSRDAGFSWFYVAVGVNSPPPWHSHVLVSAFGWMGSGQLEFRAHGRTLLDMEHVFRRAKIVPKNGRTGTSTLLCEYSLMSMP